MTHRHSVVRVNRDAIADEVLAQWFDQASVEWMKPGRRTVSIDRRTGRVLVTVSLRDSGGRRCILRVSRILETLRRAVIER